MGRSVLGQIPKLVLCVCVEGWIKTLVRGRELGAPLKWSLDKSCQSQDRLVVKPVPGGSQNNMQHFLA